MQDFLLDFYNNRFTSQSHKTSTFHVCNECANEDNLFRKHQMDFDKTWIDESWGGGLINEY